jgi:hypothetical protein
MTEATIIPAPMQRRHRWDLPRSVLTDTPSGCEETERECVDCHLVKITVHPPFGFPYRAWRTAAGMRATIEHTPPCNPIECESVASSVNQEKQHQPETTS